jgi:hypothetical protein
MKALSVVTLLALVAFANAAFAEPTTINTRIGPLTFTHDFENGYPTKETQEKLFDEMDFQRATQAYLWGLPIVAFAQWHTSMKMCSKPRAVTSFSTATTRTRPGFSPPMPPRPMR